MNDDLKCFMKWVVVVAVACNVVVAIICLLCQDWSLMQLAGEVTGMLLFVFGVVSLGSAIVRKCDRDSEAIMRHSQDERRRHGFPDPPHRIRPPRS